MYIYNRISRFQGGEQPLVGYKIKRHTPIKIIRNKPAVESGSITPSDKLKPLTKQNTEFLTQLGYKVLK